MPKIDNQDRRYLLGKHRGLVVDNNDPEKLGRVKVKVRSIWGEIIHHAWAEPNFPSTEMFTVPPIESQVWVEFAEGDPNEPIWTGCFLKSDEPHTEAKTVSPKARSIKTEEGLRVTLDDDSSEITIQASNLNTKITLKKVDNKIVIDAEAIDIGEGATEPIVLGTSFQTLFNAHTHPYLDDGIPSVTSPPSSPMTAAQLSSKHKVES